MLCSPVLEYQTMNEVQTLIILSVIHHCHTPLEINQDSQLFTTFLMNNMTVYYKQKIHITGCLLFL
jgi:hypothetical protein